MKFMGIWPEERRWNKISSYAVILPILMITCFVCAPQTANLCFIWGNIDLIAENLSMGNMTITISLLKTIIFWLNGKSLKSLLTYMARDWRSTMKKKDRDVMRSIARISRLISIRSMLLCHSVSVSYIVLRRFMSQRNDHRLLFRAYFPYDIGSSPNYELTVLGQIIACMYAATTYTVVDTFVGMLVLHVCGQLSILRHELENLRTSKETEFRIKLSNIVRKHEYLSRFANKIEECFSVMLLAQMLGCTVQLCFQCFQALMSFNEDVDELLIFQFLFLSIYVTYVLLQLYLYCYVGEKLLVESTKIAYAAYSCEWYNLSANDAKLLLIIMCRANSPLQLTAGRFCSFSMELYAQVLKTSMGYVSVIYAMKTKA